MGGILPVFLFLFIILPVAELVVLIQVGSVIGALNTVALVFLTAIIGAWLLRQQGLADRKSTRLNSSHVRISYAVFCLKKKNKNEKMHRRNGVCYDVPFPFGCGRSCTCNRARVVCPPAFCFDALFRAPASCASALRKPG